MTGELETIPTSVRHEVYLVAVAIGFPEGAELDWRQSPVRLAWNTESAYRAHRTTPPDDPCWHRHEWLSFVHPPGRSVGTLPDDPAGATLRERWARDEGIWYEDDADEDRRAEQGGRLLLALGEGLAEVIRTLHVTGAVERTFGRPVPVTVVSEDEHHPAPAWSRVANPPALHEAFVAYYDRRYSAG